MTRRPSKREFLRYRFNDLEIRYMVHGVLGRGKLENISLGGCTVSKAIEPVEIGENILIAVEFEKLEKPLEFKAKILRVQESSFAVHFTELDDSCGDNLSTIFAQAAR